jgi:hypothetical protein
MSNSRNRALEMFQNGQGVDCVIEVAPQIDGQDTEIKVFFYSILCALFSKIRILNRVNLTEECRPKLTS